MMQKMNVYLEIGKKKTFAGALDWPGWCRSGYGEQSALQALYEYGPRYAEALRATQLEFYVPESLSSFKVVETLEGNATTDFGSPGRIPSSDSDPVGDSELKRFQDLLKACWGVFDGAAKEAVGKDLRKGPRGGGRDLEKMVSHLIDADLAYLRKIGWRFKKGEVSNPANKIILIRQTILEALSSAVNGDLPKHGARGGLLWSPRYYVRRVAWHVLDHAWEIEDRMN